MITSRGVIRSAARRLADAADRAVSDLAKNLVEQEPHFTDRLLGRMGESINGYKSKGVIWRAMTLTDHGPGSQERQYGADFVGVLEINLPEYKVQKGFLAQAKLLKSNATMKKSEFERLLGQCEQMLELSPAAFVFLYSLNGIRVVPAISIAGASSAEDAFDPDAFYSRKLSRFYEEHFECFIGDRRIHEPSERTLKELRAQSLMYIGASVSNT